MSSISITYPKSYDCQVEVFGVPSGSTVGVRIGLTDDESVTITGIGPDWIEKLAVRLESTLIAWRMSAKDKGPETTYLGVHHTQAHGIIDAELSKETSDEAEERTARIVPVDTHAEQVKRAMRHGWSVCTHQAPGHTRMWLKNSRGWRYLIRFPW